MSTQKPIPHFQLPLKHLYTYVSTITHFSLCNLFKLIVCASSYICGFVACACACVCVCLSPFQLSAGQLGECLLGTLPVALLLLNQYLAATQHTIVAWYWTHWTRISPSSTFLFSLSIYLPIYLSVSLFTHIDLYSIFSLFNVRSGYE